MDNSILFTADFTNPADLSQYGSFVYDTTIFSHLQRTKMETAWHLLQQGSCSVTQAASEVGYTNISHFSNAFRKQFFINPGTLKKAGSVTGSPPARGN